MQTKSPMNEAIRARLGATVPEPTTPPIRPQAGIGSEPKPKPADVNTEIRQHYGRA